MSYFYKTINSLKLLNAERTEYPPEFSQKIERIKKLKEFFVKLNAVLEEYLISETREDPGQEYGITELFNAIKGRQPTAADIRCKLANCLIMAPDELSRESEFGAVLSVWGKTMSDIEQENEIFLSQLFMEFLKPIQDYHNTLILNFFEELDELEDLKFELDVVKSSMTKSNQEKYEKKCEEVSNNYKTQQNIVNELADDLLIKESSFLKTCLSNAVFAQKEYYSNCAKGVENFIKSHSLERGQLPSIEKKRISVSRLKSWKEEKLGPTSSIKAEKVEEKKGKRERHFQMKGTTRHEYGSDSYTEEDEETDDRKRASTNPATETNASEISDINLMEDINTKADEVETKRSLKIVDDAIDNSPAEQTSGNVQEERPLSINAESDGSSIPGNKDQSETTKSSIIPINNEENDLNLDFDEELDDIEKSIRKESSFRMSVTNVEEKMKNLPAASKYYTLDVGEDIDEEADTDEQERTSLVPKVRNKTVKQSVFAYMNDELGLDEDDDSSESR